MNPQASLKTSESTAAIKPRESSTADSPVQSRIATSIVIPAYNEESGLPLVLGALQGISLADCEIVVVDDGSTDASAEVAGRFPCRVIRHPENRGKGAALRTGLEQALGEKIIFLDADNTYPVELVPPMAALLDEYDVVRGTRSLGRDHIPMVNRFGNFVFDAAVRVLHSVDGGDVLSGMYGGRREALLRLNLESDAFDIETEIVAKAKAHGLRMGTLPITYSERVGEKKLKVFRDGTRILYRIIQLSVAYNPLLTLIGPGVAIFTLGAIGLFMMLVGIGRSVLHLPLAANSTFLFGMLMIVGMQIAVFGLAVYEAGVAYGLRGRSSASLEALKRLLSTQFFILIGLLLVLIGFVVVLVLALDWFQVQGPFNQTPELVAGSLALIIGVQIVSSAVFISALKRLQHSHRPSQHT